MSRPRIALATAAGAWAKDDDAEPLCAALGQAGAEASAAIWDDDGVDWSSFDLVVIRSTWDYTARLEEYLAWATNVEAVTRLANPSNVLRWNTDKRYLVDLVAEGHRVVPTTFISPDRHGGEALSDIDRLLPVEGDFVVKPTVSAGAADTTRHTQARRGEAVTHVRSLLDAGRHVMVQPYLDSVDTLGETGMVFIDGVFSHAFRKDALLRNGSAKMDELFALESIGPHRPDRAELDLAEAVLATAQRICGSPSLLYARVDVLRDPSGEPTLLELELTEPSFFLAQSGHPPAPVAEAIVRACRRGSGD